MRVMTFVAGAVLVAGTAVGVAQGTPAQKSAAAGRAAAPGPNEVAVTVTYTGKAPVDDTHEIWVFLFDSPKVGAGTLPVAVQTLKKSGGTATFKNITVDPVYVAVAFDEKGDYDGNAAPPPPGTPIGLYVKDGQPIGVKPGATATVKLSFDESRRR